MKMRVLSAIVVAVLVLNACGGGGGGGGSSAPVASDEVKSEDSLPTGPRVDLAAKRYFPMSPGDSWLYSFKYPFERPPETRSFATNAQGDIVRLTETAHRSDGSNAPLGATSYRRTSEGLIDLAPLGDDAPASANQVIGPLLRYAEPFYPTGSVRRSVREGGWGADVDNDRTPERFRFEFSQIVVGFESLSTGIGELTEVARIRTTTALTLFLTRVPGSTRTLVYTEEEWFAPGVGLVRSNRSVTDERGTEQAPAETLEILVSGVGGRNVLAPPSDGTLKKLSLMHSRIVFDAVRGRYHVSVQPTDAVYPNRVVSVDASSGSIVAVSPILGADPYSLALVPDSSALYVGIGGTGDVVQLALPGLTEAQRVRLPSTPEDGQAYADALAVSPIDPDTVVVSMGRGSIRPRYAIGVGVIRAGVLQPRIAATPPGHIRHIVFGPTGAQVYGADTQTSPPYLYALTVLLDGVRLDDSRRLEGINIYPDAVTGIDASSGTLLVDRTLFRTSDLAPVGTVSDPAFGCRAQFTSRLVCAESPTSFLGTTRSWRIAVLDRDTRKPIARPVVEGSASPGVVLSIIPGPSGQVAVSRTPAGNPFEAAEIWLFDSELLR